MHSRKYELIVFGATGFTGKYTCEHIVSHLPTDLMWAVAGRSESKLQCLVDELRSSNPDRVAPGEWLLFYLYVIRAYGFRNCGFWT